MQAIQSIFASSTSRAILSLLLIVFVGIVFNAEGSFFQWETHRDMLRQISVYGILACGLTLVIIAGGIDLSVGSLLGLCAVTFSLASLQWGWSPAAALPFAISVGAILGATSGWLVGQFSLQPFVATLAMMVFARGAAKLVSGGQKVSTAIQLEDGSYQYVEPPAIVEFLNTRILGDNVAVVTIVLGLSLLLCGVFLAKTKWGRSMYAVDGNEEAARLAGIPIHTVKVLTYALSGVFCAVAGICQAAQEQQGDPESGLGYELTAIAIVVIGGTSLRGGSGSMWLTTLGILTIGYLEKILSINAIGEETRLMLSGVIIVAAVLIQKRNVP